MFFFYRKCFAIKITYRIFASLTKSLPLYGKEPIEKQKKDIIKSPLCKIAPTEMRFCKQHRWGFFCT